MAGRFPPALAESQKMEKMEMAVWRYEGVGRLRMAWIDPSHQLSIVAVPGKFVLGPKVQKSNGVGVGEMRLHTQTSKSV